MPLTDDHQLVSWDDRPATLRRLRTLMLVLTIAVPAFLAGLLVVLWRLA